MKDAINVTALVTTWIPATVAERLTALEAMLRSWDSYLHNQVGRIFLHIADDGSDQEWFGRTMRIANAWIRQRGMHYASATQQVAGGVGASLNAAMAVIPEDHLILYAVDDWRLDGPLDLAPYARALAANWENAGMFRFFPHPNICGQTRPSPAGWVMSCEPGYGYGFGFRPFLAHRRFFDLVGPFAERVSSMDCERDYNLRWAAQPLVTPHSRIFQAIHTPSWTPIETGSLADLDPTTRPDSNGIPSVPS